MDEQEDLESKKYDRLLNIVTWADNLTWIVVIWFFIAGVLAFLQNFVAAQYGSNPPTPRLFLIAKSLIDLLSSLMQGFIYALLLRGISLGLKMIIETDLNFRDNAEEGGTE
jgi:hypothetical protein